MNRPAPAPAFVPLARMGRRARMGLAGLSACLLLSCGEARMPELRIGYVMLENGPLTPLIGVPGRQGADIAIDAINAAGGVDIDGVMHRLVLRQRASEHRPDAAATAVGALINIDSVDAVIATLTSVFAAPAAGVAQAAQVIFIAPMASNPGVTEGRDFAFRLAFTDAFQGQLLANFAYDSLASRRVAALADEASPYAREIVGIFRDRFEARGGRVVSSEVFGADDPRDYRPQLRRMLATRPDAILLPNLIGFDSVQVRQARALGFTGRFLGTDSWDPGAISSMPMAVGTIIVANWDYRSPTPRSREFVRAYGERFGGIPRTASAATRDAVHLIAAAATKARTRSGPALAQALSELGDFSGASAEFRFQGPGAPRRGAVLVEVLAGRDSLRLVTRPDD